MGKVLLLAELPLVHLYVMIRCLIVDDEQPAFDILVHYINQTPLLQLAASTTNPLEALQIGATQKVDLIFLDIQMPELSGIHHWHRPYHGH